MSITITCGARVSGEMDPHDYASWAAFGPCEPHHQVLYRLTGADGLLYVGITGNLSVRWQAHQKRQPWWQDVEWASTECFADRWLLEQAELQAIRTEHPEHNVNGRPRNWRELISA